MLWGDVPHFSLLLLPLTEENRAKFFLRATLDGQGATDKEICSPRECPKTETSCRGTTLNLHPRSYPKLDWIQPGGTSPDQTCSEQQIRPEGIGRTQRKRNPPWRDVRTQTEEILHGTVQRRDEKHSSAAWCKDATRSTPLRRGATTQRKALLCGMVQQCNFCRKSGNKTS